MAFVEFEIYMLGKTGKCFVCSDLDYNTLVGLTPVGNAFRFLHSTSGVGGR
jgi:hypothetical protein